MSSKLQPSFWGGLFIGVLSALPFVSALNMCCCLWVIAGGVLTSYLVQERSLLPIKASDGAIAGLVAGLIGAVIATVLGALVAAVTGMDPTEALDQVSQADVPPEITAFLDRARGVPAWIWTLSTLAVSMVVYPIFSMLGALLGVAMFKKNVPPGTVEVLPPEPPQAF
jgi:hypothetical protein